MGWSDTRKAFLTFALNRVIELDVLPGRAKLPVPFDPSSFFRHSIGITVNDGKVSQVVFEFLRPINELVMIEPLHASQRILKHNTQYVRIFLDVHFSDELFLKLMGYGPYVKVIRTVSLRRKLREWFELGWKNQGG